MSRSEPTTATQLRAKKAVAIASALVGLALLGAPAGTVAGGILLENPQLRLAFDPANGSLVEFGAPDAASLIQSESGSLANDLWQIQLTDRSAALTPRQAQRFHWARLGGGASGLRLCWSEFEGLPSGFAIEAVVTLGRGESLSRWSLRVTALPAEAITKISYPRMLPLAKREEERLAVPFWLGQLSSSPRSLLFGETGAPRRLEWPYPGYLSMQCLAWYSASGPGLYLACDDTNAFNKAFAVFGAAPGRVGCEATHFPEHARGLPAAAPSRNWELPYRVELGVFEGDWITAAEQYRAWATNCPWATQSRLKRGLPPRWMSDTALWVWNRGRSEAVLTPAVELQKAAGLPVSVFWHWWHGCSYDSGFPEYLPPREGAGPFSNALAAAHGQGIHALVYMNQRLWGMNTASWKEKSADIYAVKNAAGLIRPEVYNSFTRDPCASMCMGTPWWRNEYATLAATAIHELGVDGIYMDQACTSLACYDRAHPHPPGGGTYWIEGFQELQRDIRTRCADAPPGLAGEGCGEAWLPYLDLMLGLQVSKERYAGADGWEPIPFFHAVYHPYALSYGNYSSLTRPPYDELWPAATAPPEPLALLDRKFSQQFRLEQARAFAWGQQPTIANFLPSHLEERREEIDYVVRLARLHAKHRKFLQHGTFLRPPKLQIPRAVIPMSRLSIYAGQQGGVKEFEHEEPLAVCGAWRAPDGEVGIALANTATDPQRLAIAFDTRAYGLPPRPRAWLHTENNHSALGRLPSSGRITLTLPGQGACVLILKR